MVKAFRFLALPALLAATAQAAPAGDRLVLDNRYSEDSDGLRQQAYYAGAEKALPALGKDAATGVRAGYWQLEGQGDRVEFTGLRVDHRQALGALDIELGVHQLFGDGWSPTLGRAELRYAAAPVTLSAGVDRELVDTVVAARRETTLDAWHGVVDYAATPEWTLVGGALLQDFSDGNARRGGLFKLVYAPAALEGFNTQLRLRRLDGDRRGVGYFSPDRFEEGLVLLQYGHALPGGRFVLTGLAGAGEQRVDARDSNGVFQAELRLRGWFTDALGLEGRGGCSNTGELVTGPAGNGYRYCYALLTLMRPW